MNKNPSFSVFFLALFIMLASSFQSYASHLVGGDFTYRCLGNDSFEITITLFQDCLPGNEAAINFDNPVTYVIFTAGPNPTYVNGGESLYFSRIVINPNAICVSNPPKTCLQKELFKFKVALPPSSTGYYIVYQRCCRNAFIQNIVNPGNTGVTFMTEIPPFSSGECPNNSAVFKSMPPQIICANIPFSYDFSATDVDGDSLTYELCTAYPSPDVYPGNPDPLPMDYRPPPYSPILYLAPYSAAMPVLGNPPLSIDLHTGILSGVPTSIGRFIVTVCAKEWRNGQLLNTLSRDVQFVITNCAKVVNADIPELADQPNVFVVECKGFTVNFKNNSTGGHNYFWDFGVPGATSTEFEPSYSYPDTGVYKVKLVVTQRGNCKDSITRLVKIYPYFNAGYTWDGLLCPDEPIQFFDTSNATYPPVNAWNWDFGDGNLSNLQNPVHVYAPPGGEKVVTLTVKTKYGCVDTVRKTFPVGFFDLSAGNDTIVVKGAPFSLQGSGAQTYKWEPPNYLSNPNIAKPRTSFPEIGVYTYVLNGSSEEGCLASDTVNIRVVLSGTIFVPTAFSPNNDGINDFLEVITVGYPNIEYFSVYNRFGQLVYNCTHSNKPKWDGSYHGKALDTGVYYWIIKVKDINGNDVLKKGDVTLLR